MYRKPVPVLFMSVMLVFFLASAGVAYGLWTQTLQISGAVSTNGLNVVWEVASGTACELDPKDPTTIHVTIQDAVQGTEETCDLRLHNIGTLSAKIKNETVHEKPIGDWTLANGQGAANTNQGEVYVEFINGIETVLPPGNSQDSDLLISVEDYAEQNSQYDFIVEVVLEQVP